MRHLAIMLDPLFEQVMVIGEGKPYLSALTVLSRERWAALAGELGLDPDAPASLQDKRALSMALERIGVQLRGFRPGKAPRRMGNGHPNIVPYQDFPTADGDMILAIGNDGQFARFCDLAGHGEWARDERFPTNAARVKHRADLLPLLRQATVTKTTAEWIALLEKAAVPCGPINDLAHVFADPQVAHRRLRVDLADAALGDAEDAADLGEGESFVVVEREDEPFAVGQIKIQNRKGSIQLQGDLQTRGERHECLPTRFPVVQIVLYRLDHVHDGKGLMEIPGEENFIFIASCQPL